ncbi:conserved protein of unknown function [Pseudodesulfovibrio profundus]|uniref:RNA-directed DNA polymerase n=1 Tax=Pseudodesulfovibrio profundus TaxID=57320 RepID=A0A2C8F315_9BACT|nr:conserved protein of unknown function [Pseudodesulfovibrio profundus]
MSFSLISKISSDLLIPVENLRYIIRTSPYRYKKYSIPKRRGRGVRSIAQPAKEVKKLQYWVIKNVLSKYPVHPAATAYKKESSILQNAEIHLDSRCLLKLDFEDFFPSILATDIVHFFEKGSLEFDEEEVNALASILSWARTRTAERVVAIGAPSSPMLTNIMLYDFDSVVRRWCDETKINYTRYADDISLSGDSKESLAEAKRKIAELLEEMNSPRLSLNNDKTVFAMKPFRRFVTGLYLSNEDKISLGRDKKRAIRAKVHHFVNGKFNQDQIQHLRGVIAFARSVEPEFVERLENKFGKLFQ